MTEQIVFVVASDPACRRALARALSNAPGLQAVTMSTEAAVGSLARSARPVAIVAELDDRVLAHLREHAETRDIPVVSLAVTTAPAAVVAAVQAALARGALPQI